MPHIVQLLSTEYSRGMQSLRQADNK